MKINEITNEGFKNAMKGVVKHYVKDWFNLTDADIDDIVKSFKRADVVELQNKLNVAGANVPTTGVIDEPTKAAIKQNPQVIAPPSALQPGVNDDIPAAVKKQAPPATAPATPTAAAGMGQKFKKATQTPMVPPSQQVAQRQQTTASTPAAPVTAPVMSPTATTKAAPITEPVILGGKKLDPRNPNDAKVLAALQAQQAAAQTK